MASGIINQAVFQQGIFVEFQAGLSDMKCQHQSTTGLIW